MKKNNNMTTFIIVSGILVLCVFAMVLAVNILPNHESNSYYVKVEDNMGAKIEELYINNNKLIVTTSGDAKEYCVKSTKSTPEINNICWKQIENNTASISIYKYKKYYVWIKDNSNNISTPMSINTKENNK